MWGIPDYRPYPLNSVEELVNRHGGELAALVGRRLDRTWGLSYVCDGRLCPTLPLVLDFSGRHLEITFEGWDRLYLSWDQLDLDTVPDEDSQDDPELEVAWRELDLPELRRLTGARMREVRVLQNDFCFEGVDGRRIEAWVLGGLEFVFEPSGAALQLFNSLNELSLGYEGPNSGSWQRTALTFSGFGTS
ncbi:hypothetical protein ACI2K4_19020 [Micromonospora sp. NPDC050397]|uniref:hypothetical protein n=1 Tax=Micromonospora sp. NPDC050397 TaxID=3364279 RepID=UPI003850791B